VAPYTVRARPEASVATPLDWEELDGPDLKARRYTVQNLFRRLAQKADPWAAMAKQAQKLATARKKLASLVD
jgi:bifunctional non-homologous end joining protein LigD